MAGSFGGTVKLSGGEEYKSAIKQITRNLKELATELKLTATQFNNEEKSISQAKQEYTNINGRVKEQRENVKNLREKLSELTEQYGENNEEVQKFKMSLNKAEIELSNMEKETISSSNELGKMEKNLNATDEELSDMKKVTNSNNNELTNMKKNFDNAGASGLKFGDIIKANVISNAIISGIKAVGSAIFEVGKGMVNAGKQAFQGYSSYEQLTGGIATLFEDLDYDIIQNANRAYKTAGMDANDYMNTVMGFGASLNQSLMKNEGNIARAAELSDQIITDMSDNANKMGTDMGMISSAYQGFAKQNYTMLDNLKLGYSRN